MSRPLRYLSAFTGIGGFDGPWDALGMECVLQIENDPHATRVLEHHFPGTKRAGDISDVTADDVVRLGHVDIYVGGFPCLGTSLGQPARLGLEDHRSGFFFEFLRLVAAGLPRCVVIENPRGLLTSPGVDKVSKVDRTGWDLHTVVSCMADLGYGFAYRVVDPREHGGSQRRERVILVFVLGADPTIAGEVLGLCGPGGAALEPVEPGPERGPDAAGGAGEGGRADLSPWDQRVWSKVSRPRAALSAGGYETWRETGVANTLTGFDWGNAARQTHLVLEDDGRVRTLTIEEWERVSDLPSGYTGVAGAPEGERAKMLGNMMNPLNAWMLGAAALDVFARYFSHDAAA